MAFENRPPHNFIVHQTFLLAVIQKWAGLCPPNVKSISVLYVFYPVAPQHICPHLERQAKQVDKSGRILLVVHFVRVKGCNILAVSYTHLNPWFVLPDGHKNENIGYRVIADEENENQYVTLYPAAYYSPSGVYKKNSDGTRATQRNPAPAKNLPNYDTEKPIIHVHGKFQITKTEEAPAYGYWKVTIPGDKDPAAQFQLGSVQVGGNKIEGVTLQADAWYTYDFYLEHPGVNSEEVVIDEKKGTKGLVYPLNTMANVYLEISGAGIDGIASGSGQVNMCKTRKKAVLTSTGAFAVRFDHVWGSEFADYGLEENESKWGDSRVNHDDITIEIVDAMPNGGAN